MSDAHLMTLSCGQAKSHRPAFAVHRGVNLGAQDQAESLVEGLAPDYVVADKAYDSDPLRATIRRQGGKPVIPSRKGHRRRRRRHDRTRDKLHNRVERFFNRLKHYRRVATRYDKLDANYEGFLGLASLFVSLA